ncbi:hypothetical protein P8X24_07460 [Pyrococcus kukulkanii]|uniref:hypothetical protein n=1 Tax=Pyrococcus kukulkanii TaxID=1609559 RepID=UPI00356513C9
MVEKVRKHVLIQKDIIEFCEVYGVSLSDFVNLACRLLISKLQQEYNPLSKISLLLPSF